MTSPSSVRPGLRANLPQFILLVAVNGLVGALVGQERVLVPLMAGELFAIGSATAALGFIVTFGIAKSLSNLAAGVFADRLGRKPVLVLGWIIGMPVPLLLMFAPNWTTILFANILLGINQGLTWSTTVIMKIDLAGPRRRGFAMGLNEFAGYTAVAFSAWFSGLLAAQYGLRPQPMYFGLAVAGLGLGLSAIFVRDTVAHAAFESKAESPKAFRELLSLGSYSDGPLAAVSRTGLVNNANDAYIWGLLPLLLAAEGLSPARIGLIVALYPAVWGIGQVFTGAISDRLGRRAPIAYGMWTQALALAWLSAGGSWGARTAASLLLGLGTALSYPALLASVGDLAGPSWRAGAIGVYRLWRDAGYVVGGLTAGLIADLFSIRTALAFVALATAVSGWDAWKHIEPTNTLDQKGGAPDGKTGRKASTI